MVQIEMSADAAPKFATDFEANFSLLPHVLKVFRALQAKQNDPQKQHSQIQAAVSI